MTSSSEWATYLQENKWNLLWMGLNIFCVVAIVILNKLLFMKEEKGGYGFDFANTLVTLHFLMTGACIWLSERAGVFEAKRIPFEEIVKLSLSQVGSVCFVNLSLFYNSVGMYQVLKLANIPVICAMEYFWISKSYTTNLKIAMSIIVMGVFMATFTEPPSQLSVTGIIYGALATVATGAYQILVNSKQKQYSCNAMQILYYQSWLTAACLGLVAVCFDDTARLVKYDFTPSATALIFGTCVIAYGVNLTVFLIVGKTSPVTYQIVGHFKTCSVIFFGFVFLHNAFDLLNFTGLIIAFVGFVGYTELQRRAPKPAPAPALPSVSKEDDDVEKAGDPEISSTGSLRDRNEDKSS